MTLATKLKISPYVAISTNNNILLGFGSEQVVKNLMYCKKAGLNFLVTGDASAKVRLDFLKRLVSIDHGKRTLYVEGANRELDKYEIEEILKYKPDVVLYKELYGRDICSIMTVPMLGHQLLTTITASNELGALYRIKAHCTNKNKSFPIKVINECFDLIVSINKDRFNGGYKIHSISTPDIKGVDDINVKEIVKFDLETRKWVKRENDNELKEKVLNRIGIRMLDWGR